MKINEIWNSGVRLGRKYKVAFWWNQQWSCFLKQNCNWYDFTIIEINFETASYSGRFLEGQFALIGLQCGFEIFNVTAREALLDRFDDMIDNFKNED